jgi:hypothetical protein
MLDEFQKAIASLAPNVSFTFRDNVIDEWDLGDTGKTKPSQSEIDAEIIKLQAEYDAQEYARNRATEYPALTEQLDEIYHNGIDSWKAVIKVTKDKYPKG